MESQDDPEKRIRDLERPLADTARASELGSDFSRTPPGSHPYPPPPPGPVPPPTYTAPPGYDTPPQYGTPPPYSYNTPYSTGTPNPGGGNRMWWIVGTLIVVGVLALAGGIAAFAAHQLSGVRSIINSTLPSSTTVPTLPRTTTRSPRPSTGTVTPSTSTSPSPGGPLDVSGIDENKTVACNDNAVTVSGISNTIVITGHCASVTVSGMKNSVTVDAVDTIEASGMNNQVTYHAGAPKISNSGVDNVVSQG
ncbi:DUF3060 domain-containing protein [Mycobacterium shigaense]|uniref:Membrane protein n=1 Tax=Mycobacterium shigaense TaxID=722731 RepID=A0A1Z4ECK0_9MYCO|nr:DUF3060 domain-containing protein [Mycobacterium shigaense]MEA1122455.1 DUF3060 domain-containing protein [Mycobacterium shigaense]PRI17114.1 hypothetical protein B2J96_01230 [Mycobacterium shigaense]BAX90673.1 membrane protein [Mycobacterium shigaense]